MKHMSPNYAVTFNERGKDAFKQKDYESAITQYKLGLLNTTPIYEKYKGLLYANIAACYLEMKQYQKCIDHCDLSLKYDQTYTKALLRRAKANEMLNNYNASYNDYNFLINNQGSENNIDQVIYITRLRHNALIKWKRNRKQNINQNMYNIMKILNEIKSWQPMDDYGLSNMDYMDKVCWNKDLLIKIFRFIIPSIIHHTNDKHMEFQLNFVNKYWYQAFCDAYNNTNFMMLHSMNIFHDQLVYIGSHYKFLSELSISNSFKQFETKYNYTYHGDEQKEITSISISCLPMLSYCVSNLYLAI